MERSARTFFRTRNQDPTRQELLGALSRTRTLISQAYVDFNNTSDGDLIES